MGAALKGNPVVAKAGRMMARFPSLYRLGRRTLQRSHSGPHPDITERLVAADRCLQSADVLLSPSRDLAARVSTMGLRRPDLTALPLVRPMEPFLAPQPGPVRFLFASSIIPTKGPDRIFSAFEKLSGQAYLSIAGHAPEYPSHPRYADDLRAKVDRHPNAQWLGQIPPDQIGKTMQGHDVLVLPSRWPENSPLVVREATATGLHVIASADGGTRELAPRAVLIKTDEDLFEAMQAATEKGRVRRPPSTWPDPVSHASTLLENAYGYK